MGTAGTPSLCSIECIPSVAGVHAPLFASTVPARVNTCLVDGRDGLGVQVYLDVGLAHGTWSSPVDSQHLSSAVPSSLPPLCQRRAQKILAARSSPPGLIVRTVDGGALSVRVQ